MEDEKISKIKTINNVRPVIRWHDLKDGHMNARTHGHMDARTKISCKFLWSLNRKAFYHTFNIQCNRKGSGNTT